MFLRRQSSSFLSSNSSRSDRRRRNNNSKTSESAAAAVVQGTQATAQAHLTLNQQHFAYPLAGFVTPVEYSLIYAMIAEPNIYPPHAIRRVIDEQDFSEFLLVNSNNNNNGGKNSPSTTTPEPTCSYAQLSALLSLAMQKWPPPPLSNDDSATTTAAANDTKSVPHMLSQALLRTVVRYATEHDLDRQAEITEFLTPAVQRTQQRLGKALQVKFLVPYLAGAALSVATGNPLPLYLCYTGGMVSYLRDQSVTAEKEHAIHLHQTASRTACVETASLLNEMPDEWS